VEVRLLRLTCRAAAGPAQPEMTQTGLRGEATPSQGDGIFSP
jgi:hypothetical protein